MPQLKNMTWPMVEQYLQQRQSIILPVGSCEQHGPTGLIGTDAITAEYLAAEFSRHSQILLAPCVEYGMAMHHMAFPGSATLSPETYTAVIRDLLLSFQKHGFRKILIINGHGGNIPFLQGAICSIKHGEPNSRLEVYIENWWNSPALQDYQDQHFGNDNGFHATAGEISLTMHIQPEAFASIESRQFDTSGEKKPKHYPLSAGELRHYFPDGRMLSNPGLANAEHGAAIAKIYIEYLEQTYGDL